MAKTKKKELKALILLILSVFVMIIAYVLLIQYKNKKDNTPEEIVTEVKDTILTIAKEDIKSFDVRNEYGEMTFILEDDTIIYKDNKDLPLNTSYVNNLVSSVLSLTATGTIGVVDSLSDFGLDKPSILVTIHLVDGTSKALAFGDKAPLTGGYYSMVEGDNKVYTVSATTYNYYNNSLEQLTKIETLPTIESANITHLTIDRKDGENFEAVYDGTKSSDYAGLSFWTIKQPFSIPVPGSIEYLTSVFEHYTSLSFSSLVEYEAKDLGLYGLDLPNSSINIEYFEEYVKESTNVESSDGKSGSSSGDEEQETIKEFHELTLFIGSKDESGNYYVRNAASNSVYTMNGATVETMLNVDAFGTIIKLINLINITDVSSLDLTFNGTTYTLDIISKTEKVDGEDKTTFTYKVNDQEVAEDAFKAFYQKVIGTRIERFITEEDRNKVVAGNTVLSVIYHLKSGETFQVEYKTFNDSFYTATVNGNTNYVTDLRVIHQIESELKNLIGK